MSNSLSVEELVRQWGDADLSRSNLRIAHLERFLFHTYEPESFVADDFFARLAKWLHNLPDEHGKKLLFQLVPELTYIGPEEFKELYRVAFEVTVARWLIDIQGISVLATDCAEKLRVATEATWFCPVTDSMLINRFFKVNSIPATNNHRPDWRFLFEAFDASNNLPALVQALQLYINQHQIRRLVLLEDFVGGGSQTLKTIKFAASNFPGLQVLFLPLVVCPDGATAMSQLAMQHSGTLRCEAVVQLPKETFFTTNVHPFDGNDDYAKKLRDLLKSTYSQVSGGKAPGSDKPYNPHGYPNHAPTGGLIVMHTNTPDNSLPLIHWRSEKWCPIFPRHSRV